MRAAVLMLAHGGPTDLAGVESFLRRVLAPRQPSGTMLARAAERYRAIGGGSPLVTNTLAQARALESYLQREARADLAEALGAPVEVRVLVGMRFTAPWLAESLAEAEAFAGGGPVAAVVMASHQSARATGAYRAEVERSWAAGPAGAARPRRPVLFVEGWHTAPGYVEAVAARAATAWERLRARGVSDEPLLLFTAHSVPVDAAEGDPEYEESLALTAAAVAGLLGVRTWRMGYQSRSERPGTEWLGPDVGEVLEEEAAAGRESVIVAPLGFVAEHLETLYDLDIALAAEADRLGLAMERAGTVQDHPAFIRALAGAVVEGFRSAETGRAAAAPRRTKVGEDR